MKTSFIYLIALAGLDLSAQTISPFVFGGGSFGTNGNMILSWTMGETFGTTLTSSGNIITQGFHQPLRLNDSIPAWDTGAFIPTGITPNGDGFNDSWVIDRIDTVTNTVYIFNRWGDLVWKANDYNNASVVWKGDNQTGTPLSSATYFFIISTPHKEFKGWIELLK